MTELVFPRVSQIVELLQDLVPEQLALPGDAIGLQLGDPESDVKKVLLALDASHSQVIEEACSQNIDLLLTHHALIYKPLKKILTSDPYQKGITKLISHHISVLNAHTNWDVVYGGVNDVIAKRLGLLEVEVLAENGIGRIGVLPEALTLQEFSGNVLQSFPTQGVRLTGARDQKIRKVACVGGAGSEWIQNAVKKGADVLVTADITYHDAQYADELGIAIVDPGHYALEKPSLEVLLTLLQEQSVLRSWKTEWLLSEVNTDPFDYMV